MTTYKNCFIKAKAFLSVFTCMATLFILCWKKTAKKVKIKKERKNIFTLYIEKKFSQINFSPFNFGKITESSFKIEEMRETL